MARISWEKDRRKRLARNSYDGTAQKVVKKNNNLHGRMRFGKYKGKLFRQVPNDYLRWCVENVEIQRSEIVGYMIESNIHFEADSKI